ncbi:MAG: PDZ domain-containing protein [Candidatus Rokubacteria bacterium]|nr:PDZ domain-containing protein [Candidatus Rokubacteria bacterium]
MRGIFRPLSAVLLLLAVAGSALAAPPPGRWGWLGVRIRDLSEQEMEDISRRHGLREGFGAMIVEVMRETPAEAAGLRTGDLVVAFRERPVVDTRTLQQAVAAAGVGETVQLTVLRGAEGRRRLVIRIAAMPEPVAAERVAAEFGFLVRDPEGQPEIGGARVSTLPTVAAVLPRSRAEAAGLRAGDVLVEVEGRPVLTLGAVRETLLGVVPDGALALLVRRQEAELQLTIKPKLAAP